jgi:hypothetical protein
LSTETTRFATIEQALEDIAEGKMVVVVDDEDRENEGDLVMAAEHVSADDINFMATHARGWICLALTGERCDELGLELMSLKNETAHQTPFTVTIEAREGVTTGISAVRTPSTSPSTRRRGRRTSSRAATSTRSRRGREGCWSAPGTPRHRSTSPAWPAAPRPVSSARS